MSLQKVVSPILWLETGQPCEFQDAIRTLGNLINLRCPMISKVNLRFDMSLKLHCVS
jgi:hypothetical protein